MLVTNKYNNNILYFLTRIEFALIRYWFGGVVVVVVVYNSEGSKVTMVCFNNNNKQEGKKNMCIYQPNLFLMVFITD